LCSPKDGHGRVLAADRDRRTASLEAT